MDHISAEMILAFHTAPAERSRELEAAVQPSDTLITELKSADALLITAPIYNFSIPSSLKAWIDHVSRKGHTFAFENQTYRGLLNIQHAVIVCTYGTAEFRPGAQFSDQDFLQPYLSFVLSSLGVAKIDFVALHGTTTDPAGLDVLYADAKRSLDLLL